MNLYGGDSQRRRIGHDNRHTVLVHARSAGCVYWNNTIEGHELSNLQEKAMGSLSHFRQITI